MRPIIIFGTGGNCIDILDTLGEINRAAGQELYRCAGFLDDDPNKHGSGYFGVKVLGPLANAERYPDCFFINGIGSPFNYREKPSIIHNAGVPTDRFETIVHPSASVSSMSELGRGVVILQNVTVASRVTIRDHVIILPNSVVSHDATIGEATCIAGGVCVSGGVSIGRSCYIGTNSSIRGNLSIGEGSLVGMGSVVIKDVPPGAVIAGNPAKPIADRKNMLHQPDKGI